MSENFAKRSVEEIFEMKFEEYKTMGDHYEESFVIHRGSGCTGELLGSFENAKELFTKIVEHHEQHHG